jgi:amidase
MAGLFEQMRAMMGEHFDEERAEPFTRALVARARRGPADGLARSIATLHDAARRVDGAFAGCDVLLCPTVPFGAYPVGTLHPEADPDEAIAFMERLAGYTAIASVAGWPAMSAPLPAPGGLPIGCHVQAPAGGDALLLEFALQLEEAAPWRDRRPNPTGWGRPEYARAGLGERFAS